MKEDLRILLEMQALDAEIGKREILKKDLPAELSNLIDSVKNTEDDLTAAKDRLNENRKNQKLKEVDIQTNNKTIGKYEDQLLAIKNNKEYKALNSEINHLKEKNSKIDDEILEQMEVETKLKEELKEAEEEVKKAKAELVKNEDRLKKRINELDSEIEERKNERGELAKGLPRTLVRRYVSLIKAKDRKAVVFMENNACGGCGFKIRPQLIIEIERGNKIVSCESCGRIVVRKPENLES